MQKQSRRSLSVLVRAVEFRVDRRRLPFVPELDALPDCITEATTAALGLFEEQQHALIGGLWRVELSEEERPFGDPRAGDALSTRKEDSSESRRDEWTSFGPSLTYW